MPPKLDVRGDIAAAEIAFYVPVAVFTSILTVRYGLSKDAGWLFLFIFSLVRIASGALLVAAELVRPVNTDLFTAAYTLEAAGLSPLMLAVIGFYGLVGQYSYSESLQMTRVFRALALLSSAALAISVAGVVESTNTNAKAAYAGLILRRVGAIMFGALYLFLIIVEFLALSSRYEIRRRHIPLLTGVTLVLPFLGVRVAYAILAAWSASDAFGARPSSNPTLAKFNPVSGDYRIFLVMLLVMEYVVVLIYLVTGNMRQSRSRHRRR